jgi:hypothetical protein
MGYLVESLELLILEVAFTKYGAAGLVRWSNYIWSSSVLSDMDELYLIRRGVRA